MPFIGAPSPREEEIFETISDRKTYTGDGIKYIFGVNYYDNHISVFQNGLKLVEGIDYNITASGQFVTFTVPPESGDVIDLIGTVNVTNLAQSSYVRETFIALENQTSMVLSTNIDPTNKINLYYNGIRLAETDFSIAYANNTLTYANPSLADDVIAADVFVPGYRMIDGTLDVTNLTQTSYAREAFENIGNTNTVALSTTIDSSYRTNAYLNGLRLFPDVDYVADYSNNSLNLVNTFANNDVLEVDLYSAGFRILENIDTQITNFSQSSYIKETFVATANQSSVVLATDITSYFKINPYVNGIRLADSAYSLNYTANPINLQGFVLAANDDIVVDMYRPGYRVQGLRLNDIDMPVSVAGQVLHSDGVGGFYFQTPTKHNEYIAAETIYAGNNVSLNDDGTISISKDRWANTQYSLSNTAFTIDNPKKNINFVGILTKFPL